MPPKQWPNKILRRALGRELLIPGLEATRALTGLGELSITEARFLGSLVQKSDTSRPIIEIGTLFGSSTQAMCLFKDPQQVLITVDNYSWNPLGLSEEAHFSLTRARLAPLTEHHNVIQIRADKDDFYAEYQRDQPALFFCDADHSFEATRADLEWARSVNASIICGDDYSPSAFPGVVRAVDLMGGATTLADELFLLG